MLRTKLILSSTVIGLLAASACWLGDYEPPSTSEGGGAPAPHREVRCGDGVCGPSEVCCIEQGDPPTSACTSPDTCFSLPVPCDGPEDCAHLGGICCGRRDQSTLEYVSVECTNACDMGRPLCRLDHDDADCPTGYDCKEERLFGSGFGYCDSF